MTKLAVQDVAMGHGASIPLSRQSAPEDILVVSEADVFGEGSSFEDVLPDAFTAQDATAQADAFRWICTLEPGIGDRTDWVLVSLRDSLSGDLGQAA